MNDEQEQRQTRADTRNAFKASVILSIVAIFAVFAVAAWYGGWFGGGDSSPTQANVSQQAPAPSGSSGTVGQAPKNPGAPAANR